MSRPELVRKPVGPGWIIWYVYVGHGNSRHLVGEVEYHGSPWSQRHWTGWGVSEDGKTTFNVRATHKNRAVELLVREFEKAGKT